MKRWVDFEGENFFFLFDDGDQGDDDDDYDANDNIKAHNRRITDKRQQPSKTDGNFVFQFT